MTSDFTVETRNQLMLYLLEFAKRDRRIRGIAVTGSAAAGQEDRWSDIDLAFGVFDPALVGAVLSDFTDLMYAQGSLHHHDIVAGAWIYRVFFLPGGLQVDLAFVEQGEFRPLGSAFELVSGEAKAPGFPGSDACGDHRLGMAARASRSKLHPAREAMAGRIHG